MSSLLRDVLTISRSFDVPLASSPSIAFRGGRQRSQKYGEHNQSRDVFGLDTRAGGL